MSTQYSAPVVGQSRSTSSGKPWRPALGDVVANNLLRTVAFLGNHMPRQRGIATFTAELSGAIQTSRPAVPCGATVADDLDTIRLCYGAADTCIALPIGSIRELVTWLDDNGKPGCPSMGGAGA